MNEKAQQAQQGGLARAAMNREVRPDPGADHKARAEARMLELLATMGPDDNLNQFDDFYIDPAIVPPGWTYNWKRVSVAGKDDPTYMSGLMRAGWTPVPADRHPNLLYSGYQGDCIEHKGQRLMECPKAWTDRMAARINRETFEQLAAKEAEQTGVDLGAVNRTPGRNSRSVGPVEIPEGV